MITYLLYLAQAGYLVPCFQYKHTTHKRLTYSLLQLFTLLAITLSTTNLPTNAYDKLATDPSNAQDHGGSSSTDSGCIEHNLTQSTELNLPYKYVGNNFSGKFHRPSCPFAKAMSTWHAELFHFRRQAVEAGQKPCRYCLPKEWTEVRAAILPQQSTVLPPIKQTTQPTADKHLYPSKDLSRRTSTTLPSP